MKAVRQGLDWLLWQMCLDWSPEKLSGFAAVGWGMWVAAFRFLDDAPGWHLLARLVSWQPYVSASWVWGPLAAGWGLRQLFFACRTFELPAARVHAAFYSGCGWTFIALAALLSQPKATGFPIYGWVAWNSFAAYYQLTMRARARGVRL